MLNALLIVVILFLALVMKQKHYFIQCFLIVFVDLFVSPEVCQFNKPRSSSVDLLIESSLTTESISPPSKTNRNKMSGETSYPVIDAGGVKKEDIYVNYQSPLITSKISSETEQKHSISLSTNSQTTSNKPETSSNSTTFTVAPSVSSSSSSSSYISSSVIFNSPVRLNSGLKSPSSLHDSTISRLIDAVSLGNEQDTCCSISALIDQFESTVDQSNLTKLSQDITQYRSSNLRHTTPKALEDLRSSHKTNTTSPKNNSPMNPQKVNQKKNHVTSEICSPLKVCSAGTCTPALISSPETAELEEVYTILDEEVLLPVSVYNLKKQTVHIQADTTEGSPSNSLRSSPAKAVHNLGKGPCVAWNNVNRNWSEIEDAEERVYEEVNDPPPALPESEQDTSKSYTSSSSNNPLKSLLHSVRGTFTEVELNVDEDPLKIMMTLPHHGNQWEGLTNTGKHNAIYQNHKSIPSYSQQKHPSSYPQPHYPKHESHPSFSQIHLPVNQQSYQLFNLHQHQDSSQPPLHNKCINYELSNFGPLHQNSYPMGQSNCEVFNNSRDFSISNAQHRSFSGNQINNRSQQGRPGNKQIKTERVDWSYNGFSSAESLPGQCAVPVNISRERGLYSPSFHCETLYSQVDYDCIMPSSEPYASQNIQPQSQSPTKLFGSKQFRIHKTNLVNNNLHPHSETSVPRHSDLESSSTYLLSATTHSKIPSPCKSKSLGDLTSEDILCNFQSKYHIISRSFVTSHMRKQKHKGPIGEATFHSQSLDPFTQQLRKLVSLEADDGGESLQPSELQQEAKYQASNLSPNDSRDLDDSPPTLTRRLSSRSQSRVRHINSRARERQQDALKPHPAGVINSTSSIGGVVRRNKPTLQNLPPNRHSTGSYITGYLGELNDRGLPEGACTSVSYSNGDSLGDLYYTDNSLPPVNTSHLASEPEVYFLLRL